MSATIALSANTNVFAVADVCAEAGLVKIAIGTDNTRLMFNLELHPDCAAELATALLKAAADAAAARTARSAA